MSASREKKQRQGKTAPAAAASAGKGKTIGYAVLAAVIVIAVVALLVWNSGLFQGRTTAVTVNGRNYSPAQVEFYYYNARYQESLNSMYASMYGGTASYDSSVDPREQTYSTDSETGEVTTYHDYFLSSAKESLVELTALLDAADAEGFKLTAEGEEAVKEALDSMDNAWAAAGYSSRTTYLRAVYGPYMTYGRYKQCVRDAQLASDFYTAKSESLTYDDAALTAYYTEHKDDLDTIGYAYLFFNGEAESTTDEEGNTVEPTEEQKKSAMDAAKSKADAALASWQAGTAFEDVVAAQEPTNSTESSTALGKNLSATYNKWLLDSGRTAGDTTVMESSNGYYVVRFLSRERVETPTVNVRHILVKAETPVDDPATTDVDESQNAPSDEQMQAAHDEAQRIFEEWQNGTATEESFAALAEQYSDDPGSNENGGLYTERPQNYFVQSFNDWCFAEGRTAGDTGLVENTTSGQYGWHVMYFSDHANPVWKNTSRDALKNEDLQEWLDGLKEGLEAVDADGLKYVATL
ncbi:MAG: peptidylprolyl isomerase [Oscillospiraceae bacterium]|nr:peptidylprolyl isomerase [Oscillospiraceae bacterium]